MKNSWLTPQLAPKAMQADRSTHQSFFSGLNTEARAALFVGLLDAGNFWLYLVGIPEVAWHGLVLSIKIGVFIWARPTQIYERAQLFIILFATLLLSVFISSAVNIENVDLLELSKYIAVIISLFLTISLAHVRFHEYGIGYAIQGAVCVVLYICMVYLGAIDDEFGRYLFFGGVHPGVGCELMAVYAVATAQSTRKVFALPLCLAFFYATSLMQTRAAMIAVLITIIIIISNIKMRDKRLAFIVILSAIVMALFALILTDIIPRISEAFFLDDEYRGIGTGLSGRSNHWAAAVEMFTNSPWFGAGVGASNEEHLQPHNFILYGLSQLGMSVIPFYVVLALLLVRAIFYSNKNGYYIISFVVMFMGQDRFINMNSYPFFVYVVVIVYANSQLMATKEHRVSPIFRFRLFRRKGPLASSRPVASISHGG
jgi:O-antigen ligase